MPDVAIGMETSVFACIVNSEPRKMSLAAESVPVFT